MIDLTLRDWQYSLKLAFLFSLILWYLKQSDEVAEAKAKEHNDEDHDHDHDHDQE